MNKLKIVKISNQKSSFGKFTTNFVEIHTLSEENCKLELLMKCKSHIKAANSREINYNDEIEHI